MPIFKGSGVAIVTPMKENLEVNYEKLEELIDFHGSIFCYIRYDPEN